MTIRYLSLFSGIGGFELGLDLAGEVAGIDFQCVGHAEIDKFAIQTYEEHFDHPNFGDVTAIKPSALPEFDLLVAGFPCQPFSTAGKRQGFDDDRGTLFFDIARILRDTRPQNFILENTQGLLSDDGGRTLQVILGVLSEMGYCVEWQVLDSQNHGVRQTRQRIFIVGHLGGIPAIPVFPMGSTVGRKVQSDPQRAVYNDGVFDFGPIEDRGPFLVVRDKAPEGSSGLFREVHVATTIDAHYGNGLGSMGNRTGVATIEDGRLKVRRFTPLEVERLFGLPEGYTAGRSDSQRYKQMGNMVVPAVIRDVALGIYAPGKIFPSGT